MRRHLPRLLLTGALLSPASLYALGLGEIRLNSALNQPFDADIELIAPTREELADLQVGLAGNELFTRYGLDRPAYLSGFEFAVTRGRDGQVTVKVRSNRSVTEPYVTLLVEASWGRGRLLREYTVLLDPPMFMPSEPQAAAPVTAPQSGARNEGRIERAPQPAAAEPTRSPVPRPEGVREEPVARATAAPIAGGTYNVERNDTLSQIASQLQPGSSRQVINQTMIAMFRANPQAFGGNINILRAGSVLRIPDIGDIESISSGEASAEVARQQEAWSGAVRTASESDAGRLRLVTPAETPTAPTPAAPATQAESAPGTGTGTQPAPPATDDKRLEVTSPGLAGAQQSATEAPAAPAAAEPDEITAEQPVDAEAEEAAAPTPAPARPRPQAAAEPASPSFVERIGDFWLVPVIAGLALLLALLFIFLKRKRAAADEEADVFDAYPPMTFEPRAERGGLGAAQPFGQGVNQGAKSRDRADAFMVEGDDDDALTAFDEPAPVTARRPEAPRPRAVEPVAEPVQATTARVSGDDTLSSETAVRFDQQDALAEADFHMAYGLYDQAADLVKIALSREPGRRDLQLKLLEIYFVWGNRDLFLDTAQELYETRDQAAAGEWDKVLIMGKQIAPEDSMFKGEAGAAHLDLVDVNLEGGENRVDVDLFAEPEEGSAGLDLEFGSGERKRPEGASAGSSSDLDFMLDDAAAGDDEPTREIDQSARTQETPTIESPALDRTSQTIRERVDRAAFSSKPSSDQTAELSLDDLGLDVDALEQTGSLEETAALNREVPDDTSRRGRGGEATLGDDEMTQLAPSLSSFDRTLEAPRIEKFDAESTGTIYIDHVDLTGNDTIEQRRPDIDSTASMKGPIDLDLGNLDGDDMPGDTVQTPRRSEAELSESSEDFLTEHTNEFSRADLDVGEALDSEDFTHTGKQAVTNEMELSELEPVTMSEVGTKLDLARAYMDMGDPDGARSILEEVLQEGTANQKQEAQRLVESIR